MFLVYINVTSDVHVLSVLLIPVLEVLLTFP